MNIWLIKEGEPLPCDEHPRLMRIGLLSEELVSQNHSVIWWSSSFEHGRKRERFDKDTTLKLFNSRSKLVLLKTLITYNKNTSISRIIYHYLLARKFYKKAKILKKPDIIFCAFPTIHFALSASKYGKKNKVPVILDVRDLWPDIFVRALPRKLNFLGSVVIYPFNFLAKKALKGAYGITGIIPSHLDWGLQKAGRNNTLNDKCFYISYKKDNLTVEDQIESKLFWSDRNIDDSTWNICFFGTMSLMTMDMFTLIEAFSEMSLNIPNMRLILCGDGDALSKFKSKANNNKKIIFPGWINKKQIQSLMEISKIGIYPFHNLPDFINSLTNKMVEYFSSGLPVVSTLRGFSKNYIEKHNVGLVYEEGSSESLINAVLQLYNSEQLRKEMSENARKRYLIDFNSSKVNNEFIQYFQSIIKRYNTKA